MKGNRKYSFLRKRKKKRGKKTFLFFSSTESYIQQSHVPQNVFLLFFCKILNVSFGRIK